MKTLTRESFARAVAFIEKKSRRLDRTIFAYRFEDQPTEPILKELAKFQNADGGFGRALEPDLRLPDSSPLATGIGLKILKELGVSWKHEMIGSAVKYLLNAFNRRTQVWRVIPQAADQHPHAPWWHDEDGSLARTFDDFLIIPRAQLVGLLHHYAERVPSDWLEELTELTITDIESIPELGTGGGDDLVYSLHLAETAALPADFRARLAKRLQLVIPQAVSRDPEQWSAYSIQPVKLAPEPDSFAAPLLLDILPLNLDYVVEHQSADGSWDPTWSWSDFYPEAWKQAKNEWRGHLTLETLTTLRAYGRIEP